MAGHLEARQFAPGTNRGYAFDLLCLMRFFADAGIDWQKATPTDFFDWLDWQSQGCLRRASGWCRWQRGGARRRRR